MIIAVALGLAATIVALIGLLGRSDSGRPWPSQVIVYALPLGIIAGGYSASLGMTLPWAIVAAVSVLLAVLAGGLMSEQPALSDQGTSPAAAGFSLALSGLIALGLASIAIIWASQLISAFSYLESHVMRLVLVLAAVAFSIGGRSARGLSRTVLILAIIGAVVMLALGALVGDPGSLTSPEVTYDPVGPVAGVLFAIGVVLIGAGYPVLRAVGEGERSRIIIAAVVVSVLTLAVLVGLLMLYGGAFNLPSLVINVFPVYTPEPMAAVICGLIAIASTVIPGSGIHAASRCVAEVQPDWYTNAEEHPVPRRNVAFVLGLVVLAVALLAPPAPAMVLVLSVLAVGNLLAEWSIHRSRAAALEPEVEPASKRTSSA